MSRLSDVLHSVMRLGTGEAVARLASFILTAYISRRYGLELLGALALAQTASAYVVNGTDTGVRLIGARVVARDNALAQTAVPIVTRKRIAAGIVCVLAGLLYAAFGPMDAYSRLCVAGFVVGVLPYTFSLDWLAWGLSRFGWMGVFRGGVGIVLLVGALVGFRLFPDPRIALVGANFLSACAGSLVLWIVWRTSWSRQLVAPRESIQSAIRELRWAPSLWLGLSVIFTQMFHCADTLLLGAMAPLTEVGRYNAAYKILFLVCAAFYLLTQSLYPKLAAASAHSRTRKLMLLGFAGAALGGTVIAACIWIGARPILAVVYGWDLGATGLLRILVFAIPMDFLASMFGVALASRGFERSLLYACGAAAIFNIGLNLLLIPRMHAMGAAYATLLSYLLLIFVLVLEFLKHPVFAERLATVHAEAGTN